MRRILIIMLWIIGSVVAFAGLYLVSDAILSRIPSNVSFKQLPKQYDIYILSNNVHTDIVLPVNSDKIDWRTIFPTQNVKSKDSTYSYVAIGWGDKGFYLNTPEWKDLTVKTALVAALGIGETALHVTYYHRIQENTLCYKFRVDEQQYKILIDYIKSSFDQDQNGNPVYINTNAQYGNSDAFYEAKGSYSVFFSCNTWINKVLKKANMPSGLWTVFDKGVLRHYGYKK